MRNNIYFFYLLFSLLSALSSTPFSFSIFFFVFGLSCFPSFFNHLSLSLYPLNPFICNFSNNKKKKDFNMTKLQHMLISGKEHSIIIKNKKQGNKKKLSSITMAINKRKCEFECLSKRNTKFSYFLKFLWLKEVNSYKWRWERKKFKASHEYCWRKKENDKIIDEIFNTSN